MSERRAVAAHAAAVLCLTLAVLTSGRASEFAAAVNYPAGLQPYSVAVGDFNRDGIPDLAAADFGGNTVSILLGQGGGVFQAAVSYAVGPFPASVAVGDFNGDGFLDLVVANTNNYKAGGSLSILLGNGDGTFQPAVNYAASPGEPFYVVVADLNHDGKTDLALADHGGDLAVYLGNGDGTFQTAVNYVSGLNPQSVAVGDFNGDGTLDLAIPGKLSNDVNVLIGKGDGTFQPAVSYPAGTSPAVVAGADFNSDGKLDLAVANNGSNNLSLLLGNGDGTFRSATTLATGRGPVGLAVADLNGDSRADIVVCALNSGAVDVLLGNGDGTFQPSVAYAAGSKPRIVAVGDLNLDGAPDLAVADSAGGVEVLLNNGGTVLATTSSLNPSQFGQPVTFTTMVNASIPGAGTPAGTVTFEDGAAVLGTATVSGGQAAFTTSTLSVGTHTINALYSGDSNFNPHVAPPLSQVVQPLSTIVVSPSSLTFGLQLLNTTSPLKVARATNQGPGTVNISGIAVSGDFLQTNTCGSSLAAGASCTISVSFKPKAINTRTGQISITDSAANSPQTISLMGTGTEVKLVPPDLTFAPQQVGTTSAPLTVTLTNVGKTALAIAGVHVGGANPGDFAQTNTCGSSVGAGASCTFSVTFAPKTTGVRKASISIQDNGGGSPQQIQLSGSGD